MHRILLHRSESGGGAFGFGQHECAGVTGIGTMAAQVTEAAKNANSSKSAESRLSPFAVAFDLQDIAVD